MQEKTGKILVFYVHVIQGQHEFGSVGYSELNKCQI